MSMMKAIYYYLTEGGEPSTGEILRPYYDDFTLEENQEHVENDINENVNDVYQIDFEVVDSKK